MSAVLSPGISGGLTLDDTRPAPRRLVSPPAALATAVPLRSQLQPPASGNRGTGIAVVVGLHLVVGWALTTGLASKAVEAIKKPIEMALLPEVLPPPPPPPPKVVKLEPVQKVAPPPAYVPPPEVVPVVTPRRPRNPLSSLLHLLLCRWLRHPPPRPSSSARSA